MTISWEKTEYLCPVCKSKLLTEGTYVWCERVGHTPCSYGVYNLVLLADYLSERERTAMTIKTTAKPVWMTKDALVVDESVTLKSTTNYDKFSFDPVNRPVDRKHVQELIDAISRKNLLREYPIVVDTKYTIIDGQHRLLAAQALNLPIFFIVSKDATIEDVGSITSLVDHWDMENQLHFWEMRGNEHYAALRKFKETYPFFSASIARDLLWESRPLQPKKDFAEGKFTVERAEFAETVARYVLDFKQHTKLHTHVPFIRAVANLAANPVYSHKRMMMKLEYLSRMIKKCPDTKTYLEMLSEIYNYKVKAADVVQLRQILKVHRGKRHETAA